MPPNLQNAATILITGAAGRVGKLMRAALPTDEDLLGQIGPFVLRSTDIVTPEDIKEGEDFHAGDLADADFVNSLFADGSVRAVIHLAGYPREAEWDVLLAANIHATINIYEAARLNGVDRVIYASSNHAVGLYPRSQTIDSHVNARPDSRYGVTKVFGEQLGFLYAHKFGVRAFNIRIGMFLPEPTTERSLSVWLSLPDTVRLIRVGLTADYVCETVYGVSDNDRGFWDNRSAEALGYAPQDKSEPFAQSVSVGDNDPAEASEVYMGGPYVTQGLVSPDRLKRLAE